MIEAMLWTMAEPLLATQLGAPPQPQGNRSDRYVPHGVYRCAGDDDWISLAVTTDEEWRRLCAIVPTLSSMATLGFVERAAAAGGDRRCARRLVATSVRLGRGGRIAARRHPGGGPCHFARPRRQRSSARARVLGGARYRRSARLAMASQLRPDLRRRAGARRGHRDGFARGARHASRRDRRAAPIGCTGIDVSSPS